MPAIYVLLAAVAVGVLAYWNYFRDIAVKETKPNRWSWLAWSITTLVEAFTFNAVNEDWTKSVPFFVSGICCVIVTLRIWNRAAWKWPNPTEALCILASLGAVVLWLRYDQAVWAHLVTILAVPIAFIPTWATTKENPRAEDSSAWWLWTIGDALALTFILMQPGVPGAEEWMDKPYAVIELLCHASTAILVSVLLIRQKRRVRNP